MQITVNGEARHAESGWTMTQLLQDLGVDRRFLAVERNQELVRRTEYDACVLEEGDAIEIVTLVGGG